MRETSHDLKIKSYKEMKDGHLFPFTRNKNLITIERILFVMSYSILGIPGIRRKIGASTFKWYQAFNAFVYMRVWVLVAQGGFDNYVKPLDWLVLDPTLFRGQAFILSIMSFGLLLVSIWVKISTTLRFHVLNRDVDSGSRGISIFQKNKLDDTAFKVVNRKWMHHCIYDPIFMALFGIIFFYIDGFMILGLFFLVNVLPFAITEAVWNFADGKITKDQRDSKLTGEKTIKKHDRYDGETGQARWN